MVQNIKLGFLFHLILVLVSNNAPSFVFAFTCGSINTECGCREYKRNNVAIPKLSPGRGFGCFEYQILGSMSVPRRPRTQLHMGLLKFFRKGKENRNDDNISDDLGGPEPDRESEDDDDNDDDGYEAPKISLNAPLSVPSPSYSQSRETVRQRMNRIVSGDMTSDEKEAFLNTALGRIGPNKNKNTAKIRQTLPLASAQKEGTTSSLSSPSGSSHSAEVSWSSVVSRKRFEQQQRYGDDDGRSIMKIELDGDEAAKQAWLNMVTSPTRFQSYTVLNKQNKTATTATYDIGLPPPASDELFDLQQSSKQQKQLQDLSDAKKRIQEQQTLFEQMAAKSGETSLDTSPFLPKTTFPSATVSNKKNVSLENEHSTITNTKNITTISEDGRKDLASRLEEAAVLQEQRDAEVRAALARQREETEQARVEQQRKMAEMARQREEEFRRLEEERLKKKREEEAQRIALEEEKRKIEEAKRKELEAAQDAYWRNKLAQEKKIKESRTAPKGKDDSRRGEDLKDTTEVLKRKIRSMQNEENAVKYGFTEMGLLEKSEAHRKEAKEAARNIIDSTAILVAEEELHSSNLSSFGETFDIAEQNAKMDALKKLQQEQQKQLRSLNSLPGHKGTSGLHPLIATASSRSSSSTTTLPAEQQQQQQQLPKVDALNAVEKPGITVGDILSGKVDPESVDVNQLIEKRVAVNNEVNQNLKKPIRQKLILDDIDLGESPSTRPPSSGTLPSVTPSNTVKKNREAGWNMSEEDKKKANKWGINLDKLL